MFKKWFCLKSNQRILRENITIFGVNDVAKVLVGMWHFESKNAIYDEIFMVL